MKKKIKWNYSDDPTPQLIKKEDNCVDIFYVPLKNLVEKYGEEAYIDSKSYYGEVDYIIIYERLETEEEVKARLINAKKEREAHQKFLIYEKERKKKEKEEEYKLFLKLKERYEKINGRA